MHGIVHYRGLRFSRCPIQKSIVFCMESFKISIFFMVLSHSREWSHRRQRPLRILGRWLRGMREPKDISGIWGSFPAHPAQWPAVFWYKPALFLLKGALSADWNREPGFFPCRNGGYSQRPEAHLWWLHWYPDTVLLETAFLVWKGEKKGHIGWFYMPGNRYLCYMAINSHCLCVLKLFRDLKILKPETVFLFMQMCTDMSKRETEKSWTIL
mgnify:CR=1 FL=1